MSDGGRSRSAVLAWTAVVVILLGVVGLVSYALTHVSTPATVTQTALTSPAVLATLSTVPAATFDAVGVTVPGTDLVAPQVLTGQPTISSGGKPEVLFVGAEYCPFCAAERWPLVTALARFGRFSVLHDATSSTQSVFPGTPTFSFHGVHYTSAYVTFTGVELYSDQIGADGSFIRIATLTAAQAALVTRSTGAGSGQVGGTTPFVDVGGRLATTTSAFSPALLTGQSQAQIADLVAKPAPGASDPTATPTPPTGQAVVAAANQLTAGICASTGQEPAAVCRSRGVRAADQSLGLPLPPAAG
jgi:thiol-disulfide isomerase/thioredoxin